ELARFYQVFHFCNGNIPGLCHTGRKITRGFSKNKIAHGISLPCFYNGEIGMQRMFHQVHFVVELTNFLACSYLSAVTSWCKKSRNTHTGHLYARGQCTLWYQVYFQLTTQQLPFKF